MLQASEPLCAKALVVITEDWFALSHFRPLIRILRGLAREVVVVTRSSGRFGEIESLGARPVPLDYGRGSANPLRHGMALRRLIDIIRVERPDVLHAIAMQPMVLSGLALKIGRYRPKAIVMHLTGLGFFGVSQTSFARVARPTALWIVRQTFGNQNAWLLAENTDDTSYMVEAGAAPGTRTSVVPGAGIDLTQFPALPPPANTPPVAAYVGRMLPQKGIEVLVEAHRQLMARRTDLSVELFGASDASNASALPRETLEEWNSRPGITWHGHVSDIAKVWRHADIAVVPSIGGEGMPRAMLEAAACARPLIVSDVPGCRHFVRDGREGLIVPPGDPAALANALERLAADQALRHRLGAAAHQRVAEGFTTHAVAQAVEQTYGRVLEQSAPAFAPSP